MKDVQREFFESGYAREAMRPEEIIADFDRLPSHSRGMRAAALLQGASGHLLDVGCGPGPLLYQMRGKFTKIIGVNIVEAQLSRVRAWAESIGNPVQLCCCKPGC